MLLYGDTSALVKLVLQEPGTEEIRAVVAAADVLACAAIGYVELRAAVAAAVRDGRVNALLREQLMLNVERVWQGVSEVLIDRAVLRLAADLAEERRLRACDAVHLAALTVFRQGLDGGPAAAHEALVFACWDTELRRGASELGFRLLPDVLPQAGRATPPRRGRQGMAAPPTAQP